MKETQLLHTLVDDTFHHNILIQLCVQYSADNFVESNHKSTLIENSTTFFERKTTRALHRRIAKANQIDTIAMHRFNKQNNNNNPKQQRSKSQKQDETTTA
jgi:hypothetical protein